MAERYGPGGYVIFPGDNGYSCCGGDVDRFENKQFDEERFAAWEEQRRLSKELTLGCKPGSAMSPEVVPPTS